MLHLASCIRSFVVDRRSTNRRFTLTFWSKLAGVDLSRFELSTSFDPIFRVICPNVYIFLGQLIPDV
jgi:hypothetical protein